MARIRKEIWMEFMDRAKANGLSPTLQEEVDRKEKMTEQERDIRKTLLDIFTYTGTDIQYADNTTLISYLENLIKRNSICMYQNKS